MQKQSTLFHKAAIELLYLYLFSCYLTQLYLFYCILNLSLKIPLPQSVCWSDQTNLPTSLWRRRLSIHCALSLHCDLSLRLSPLHSLPQLHALSQLWALSPHCELSLHCATAAAMGGGNNHSHNGYLDGGNSNWDQRRTTAMDISNEHQWRVTATGNSDGRDSNKREPWWWHRGAAWRWVAADHDRDLWRRLVMRWRLVTEGSGWSIGGALRWCGPDGQRVDRPNGWDCCLKQCSMAVRHGRSDEACYHGRWLKLCPLFHVFFQREARFCKSANVAAFPSVAPMR